VLQPVILGCAPTGVNDDQDLRISDDEVSVLPLSDVGRETHFDGLHSPPLTTRAAAVPRVEAKAGRSVDVRLGLQRFGEDLVDGAPEADVVGEAGSVCLADGRLVNLQHTVNVFKTPRPGATRQRGAETS
jgi:hypothetical protein